MSNRSQRRQRRFFRCAVGLAFALGSAGVTGAWAAQSQPGLYRLKGWGGASQYQGTTDERDVNGEVGHTVYVHTPTGDCRPGGNWNGEHQILSGTLPPGLSFGVGSRTHSIGGIPEERGHWIVRLAFTNIDCNGQTYRGFEQVIRFHITGSGRVVQ